MAALGWLSNLGFAGGGGAPFAGGPLNAIEFFPTGGTVTIILYDPETGAVIALDSDVCVENGTTGMYFWETTKITTSPTPYKEYGWKMTDGTLTKGGKVKYEDFFTQYLVNEQFGI